MYAKRRIGELMLELDAARRAYADKAEGLFPGRDMSAVRVKNMQITKPTERAAVVLVDTLGAEVDAIEQQLSRERCTVDTIDALVSGAGLDAREREYVQLRYFEGRSAAGTAARMGYSVETCFRLRRRALDKLGSARLANAPRTPHNAAGRPASGGARA